MQVPLFFFHLLEGILMMSLSDFLLGKSYIVLKKYQGRKNNMG